MKTIHVHIGMHKTGSSFLQNSFKHNRNALIRSGILFPKTGYEETEQKGGRKGTTSGHNGYVKALFNKRYRVKLLTALAKELEESGCDQLFISCENITHPLLGDCSSQLKALFVDYNVKVLVTLRDPIEWMDSYYKEVVSNGWGFESREPLNYVTNDISNIKYEKILRSYFSEFGKENVSVMAYGQSMKDIGVENVFLNYFELSEKVSLTESENLVNESSNVDFVESVRRFNLVAMPTQSARNSVNLNRENLVSKNGLIIGSKAENLIRKEFKVTYDYLKGIDFYFGNIQEISIKEKYDYVSYDENVVSNIFVRLCDSYNEKAGFSGKLIACFRKFIADTHLPIRIFFKRLWVTI